MHNTPHTEETKQKLSAIMRLRWQDSGYREKCSDAAKQRWNNPKERQKMSETKREQWKNPEYKAKLVGRRRSKETKLKMSLAHRGEKNWNWKGGISFDPYPVEFIRIKEKIRERDNHRCRECLRHQSEFSRKLPVHHRDGNKDNNTDDNLITLCVRCHSDYERRLRNNTGEKDE